jgi:hypothetical protein
MNDDSIFEGLQTPNTDQLKELQTKGNEALNLSLEVEDLELQLKNKKEELRKLTEVTLPDLMSAVGMKKFETDAGAKIEVRDFVNGSLPKDAQKRAEALDWLVNNGAGDLIKNSFSVKMNREQQTEAVDLYAYLKALGVDFERKEDVHPQTLAAEARQRMKDGMSVPLETLGLYAGKHAKVSKSSKL